MTFSSKLCVMLQGRIQYIPQMSHQAPDVWWSRCLSRSKWLSKTQTHTHVYTHTLSGWHACINMCSHIFQMVCTHVHTHKEMQKCTSHLFHLVQILIFLILIEHWYKQITLYIWFCFQLTIPCKHQKDGVMCKKSWGFVLLTLDTLDVKERCTHLCQTLL